MTLRSAQRRGLNWGRGLLRLWLLFAVAWIASAAAFVGWQAVYSYQDFSTRKEIEVWEAEFRARYGMSHTEWCSQTAMERIRSAEEECSRRIDGWPFTKQDCLFAQSQCFRPLLRLPPEGFDRLRANTKSVVAYLAEEGTDLALRLALIGLLPPLGVLAVAIVAFRPLLNWIIAGFRS